MSQKTYPNVYPDDASVKANAESYLTSAQRQTIADKRKETMGLLLAYPSGIALVVFFILMFGLDGNPNPRSLEAIITALGKVFLVWGGLGLIYLGFHHFFVRPYDKDLHKGEVHFLDGKADAYHITQNGRIPDKYGVCISGRCFRISEEIFNSLETEAQYRIYYTPHTKTLLSFSRIENEA